MSIKAWLKTVCLATLLSATVQAQNLTISSYSDITDGLDPHDSSATPTYSMLSGIFERLFQFDKDMKVVPVLATGYTSNDDATQFVIKLREGVVFHNGEPFNAEAVKLNLERLANPENRLKRNTLLRLINTVKVVDEYTVEIDLKEPFGAMINTLAHPSVVMHSPKSLAQGKEYVATHPEGTGPFTYVSWEKNRAFKVTKNTNYWRKDWPKVDNVTFVPTPEASTRVAKLKAGEVDAVYYLPPDLLKSINQKGLVIDQRPGIMQYYVSLNNQKEILSNKKVRQALNMAINREIWLKVVYSGMGTIVTSPIPPLVQFYAKQSDDFAFNIPKATELLKEAGYPKGFDMELWSSDGTDMVRTAQFIKQQLSKINVRVKVVPMDAGTRNQRLWSVKEPKEAKFDMYLGGWSSSTGDADWALRPLFATESWIPHAYNAAYYSNPEVDKYIAAGLETADLQKRADAYAKAQALIWDDQPVIFLGEPDNLLGKKENLEGIYILPDLSFVYSDAYFK